MCRHLLLEVYVGVWKDPTAQVAPTSSTIPPAEIFWFDSRAKYEATRQQHSGVGEWSGGGGMHPNPKLIYPMIMLVAFLAIKGVMALPPLKSSQIATDPSLARR